MGVSPPVEEVYMSPYVVSEEPDVSPPVEEVCVSPHVVWEEQTWMWIPSN